jgi:hypothetical protein
VLAVPATSANVERRFPAFHNGSGGRLSQKRSLLYVCYTYGSPKRLESIFLDKNPLSEYYRSVSEDRVLGGEVALNTCPKVKIVKDLIRSYGF